MSIEHCSLNIEHCSLNIVTRPPSPAEELSRARDAPHILDDTIHSRIEMVAVE